MPLWAKGQSGNPTGRPKSKRQSRTITELARTLAPKALQTLGKIMQDPKSSSTARAIAADRILDRAYGKAPQSVGVVLATARKPGDYSDAELAAIIAGAPALAHNQDDTKLIEAVAIEEEAVADTPSAIDGQEPQSDQ